jgi:hypothetical protein
MDKDSFDKADLIARAADVAENLLDSGDMEELSALLTELNKAMGKRYAVVLEVNIHVFDRQKEQGLPLVQVGLAGFAEGEPYRTSDGGTLQKYIADGEIHVVPHDRCPKCWEPWDSKFKNQSCVHCGATLGKDVKVLLDTDVCPQCKEGKVSVSNPACDKCGYRVDPKMVAWG